MDGFSLWSYVGLLPNILLCIVGIVLALIFWRRCPGASAMTLIALIVLLLSHIVQPFLLRWVTGQGAISMIHLAFFVFGLIQTAALALIMAAVFVGRNPPAYSRPPSYGPSPSTTPIAPPPLPVAPPSASPVPANYSITARPPQVPHDL